MYYKTRLYQTCTDQSCRAPHRPGPRGFCPPCPPLVRPDQKKMKPLPTLEFCCCGCTLRLGVQIIGFAGLILALPGAINSLKGAPEISMDNQPADAQTAILAINAGLDSIYMVGRIVSWSSVLWSSLLLYGVFWENRSAILSVAIINIIEIVLVMLFGIGLAIATKTVWIVFIAIVVLLLPFYLAWVEYSYFEELRSKQNSGGHV